MKHTLKSRTTVLAAVLATTAVLAGCSKEKAPEKVIEPEPETYDNEVVLYVNPQNKVLNTGSSLTYLDETDDPIPWYFIEVELVTKDGIRSDTAWVEKGTRYIRKEFSDKPVTGIEVIANANYDTTHPKGASLNDLMKVDYPKPDGMGPGYLTMDMAEYFSTLGKVWLHEGWSFRLFAKTPPAKENEAGFYVNDDHPENFAGVTLKLTLEDGTVIEIVPEDWGPIPTE